MIRRRLFPLALSMAVFFACTKQVLAPLDAEDEYNRAMSNYRDKKYDRALQGFERVIFYHASSEYVDDAQYWLAHSYYAKKDYAQAIIEFDYIIRNFPASPFLEEAYLNRAKSYLASSPGYDKDQTETREAIGYLDEFLTRFPNSANAEEAKNLILAARNKLARKELESGRLYLRMQEPAAAAIYLQYVIDNFPETGFVSEARFLLAGIYENRKDTAAAIALYQELLADSSWKAVAEKKIKLLESTDR